MHWFTFSVVRSVSVASRSQCASSTVSSQLQPEAHSTRAWPMPCQLRRYSRCTCEWVEGAGSEAGEESATGVLHSSCQDSMRGGLASDSVCRLPGQLPRPGINGNQLLHCLSRTQTAAATAPTCTASSDSPPSAVSTLSVATAPGSRAVRPHLKQVTRRARQVSRCRVRCREGSHRWPILSQSPATARLPDSPYLHALLCSLLRHKGGFLRRAGLVSKALGLPDHTLEFLLRPQGRVRLSEWLSNGSSGGLTPYNNPTT